MNLIGHSNSKSEFAKAGLEILETLVFIILITVLPIMDSGKLMNSNQSEKFFFFSLFLSFLLFIRGVKILFSNRSHVIRITWFDILLVIYFLYITCNRFVIAGIVGNTQHYFETIGLAFLYVLLRTRSQKTFHLLFFALLIAGTVQAVYGNLQLYSIYPSHHNLFKITGGFFNPGPYAGYLASIFPVSLVYYLFHDQVKPSFIRFKWFHNSFKLFSSWLIDLLKRSKILKYSDNSMKQFEITLKHLWTLLPKYIALVSIITILLVLPATRSRAAWISVLVSSFFLLSIKYDVKNRITKYLNSNIKKGAALFVVIAILVITSYALYQFKQGSADGRLLIWKTTAKMIKDKPVFGVGYEKFQANYMNYQAEYFKQNPESEFVNVSGDNNYAFNELLKIGSEMGIVGLLLVLFIIFMLFARNKQNKDATERVKGLVARSGILAILVFSLFSYPGSILPIKLNFVLLLAFTASQSKPITIGKTFVNLKHIGVRISLAVCIMVLLAFYYPLFRKWYQAHMDWQSAYNTYQMGAYEASLENYEKALSLLTNNGTFLVNYGKALSMAEKHKKAVEVLNNAQNYLSNTIVFTAMGDSYKALGQNTKAEESYYHAWHMIPSRFYPKYLLAKLYDETGQRKKALETASELLNKEIKIQSTAIEEIKNEMKTIIKNEGK